MQRVSIDDPAWLATFPRWVGPLPNEWLPGLLLRCDMVNGWAAGTTVAYLLRTANKPSFTGVFNEVNTPITYLKHLSQVLALPISSIIATTYYSEIVRVSGRIFPFYIQTRKSFHFFLCPECIAQTRLLTRSLLLPEIRVCPYHHLKLLSSCLCSAPLRLFRIGTLPFTCSKCGLDWGKLPQIGASMEHIVLEQRLLSYYSFFLSRGTPSLIKRVLRLIEEGERKKTRVIPYLTKISSIGERFAATCIMKL